MTSENAWNRGRSRYVPLQSRWAERGRFSRLTSTALRFAIAIAVCVVFQPAWAQSSQGEIAKTRSDELAGNLQALTLLVGLAEQACLSNRTQTESAGISANLRAILNSVTSGASIERQVKDLRGAPDKMTGEVAKLENDEIRK